MGYSNYKGIEFNIDDIVYYNYVEKGALNIVTKKTKIKSFLIKKDGIYIVTKTGSMLTYVNIDDIYLTEEDAKEVVIRWQKEVLRKQLQQEITSYLKNQ